MASTALDYTLPTENLAPSYTPTLLSGTTDSNYPLTNLVDQNPAKPWKTTGTSFSLRWDFGSTKTVKLILIVHANFAPACTGGVSLGDDVNGISNNFNGTITPTYLEDGFPRNIAFDLRATSNPTGRYLFITLSGNGVACAIGEVGFYTAIHSCHGNYIVPKNPHDDEEHLLLDPMSDAGIVNIYEYGTKRRTLNGFIYGTSSDMASIRTFNRSTHGRSKPFAISAHLPNDDEWWFARFMDKNLARPYIHGNGKSIMSLPFEELSRGLPPTPSSI